MDRIYCGRKMFGLAWRMLLLMAQLCINDCNMLSLRRGAPRRCSGVSTLCVGGPTYWIGSGCSGVVKPGPACLAVGPVPSALWMSSIVSVSVIPGVPIGVLPPLAGGIVIAALILAGSGTTEDHGDHVPF